MKNLKERLIKELKETADTVGRKQHISPEDVKLLKNLLKVIEGLDDFTQMEDGTQRYERHFPVRGRGYDWGWGGYPYSYFFDDEEEYPRYMDMEEARRGEGGGRGRSSGGGRSGSRSGGSRSGGGRGRSRYEADYRPEYDNEMPEGTRQDSEYEEPRRRRN